jgi:hypothetical protein
MQPEWRCNTSRIVRFRLWRVQPAEPLKKSVRWK